MPSVRGAVSEDELLAAVIDLARLHRWRSFHARPAGTRQGPRTAVQGDGAGFPDLLLVRDARLIVAELKTGGGEFSEAQQDWLLAFAHTAVERYIWRPIDLVGPDHTIERILH